MFNPTAEHTLLSALMTHNDVIIPDLKPDMFTDIRHQYVFEAIVALDNAGKTKDFISVTRQLKASGHYNVVGNEHLMTLLKFSCMPHRIADTADMIKFDYYNRQLNAKLVEAIRLSSEGFFEEALKATESALNVYEPTGRMKHISEVMELCEKDLNRRVEIARAGNSIGVDTGLDGLQILTGGFMKGEMIILAARPGRGKTAVGLHFAKSASITGKKVAFFSLEMTEVSLGIRLILSEANVCPERYRDGKLFDIEFEAIEKARHRLSQMGIFIDDSSSMNTRKMKAIAKRLKRTQGLDLVIIDYLQIEDMDSEKGKNREREVAEASKATKNMAKELDIPVVLLSQLNRDVEGLKNKRPNLSHLKESGAIEADADVVIFVYRPAMDGIEEIQTEDGYISSDGYMELIVEKNRNGKTGAVRVRHNEGMTVFSDWKQPEYQTLDVNKNFEPQKTPF